MNSESMNLEEAQQWAFSNLNLNEEDWPEEKWLELSGSTGTVNREDTVKLFEELTLTDNNDNEDESIINDERKQVEESVEDDTSAKQSTLQLQLEYPLKLVFVNSSSKLELVITMGDITTWCPEDKNSISAVHVAV
jgi:hypothetical protein